PSGSIDAWKLRYGNFDSAGAPVLDDSRETGSSFKNNGSLTKSKPWSFEINTWFYNYGWFEIQSGTAILDFRCKQGALGTQVPATTRLSGGDLTAQYDYDMYSGT